MKVKSGLNKYEERVERWPQFSFHTLIQHLAFYLKAWNRFTALNVPPV